MRHLTCVCINRKCFKKMPILPKHEDNFYVREDFSKIRINFKCSHFKTSSLSDSFRVQPLRRVSLPKKAIIIFKDIDGQ